MYLNLLYGLNILGVEFFVVDFTVLQVISVDFNLNLGKCLQIQEHFIFSSIAEPRNICPL